MGSMAVVSEGPVFDSSPLFSRRIQRWEPGASQSHDVLSPREPVLTLRSPQSPSSRGYPWHDLLGGW